MGFFSSFLVKNYFQNHFKSIEKMLENPHVFQKNIFKNLLHKNRNTQFGTQYNFGKITQFTQFQKQVPIQTYEQIQPFIEKIMRGEKNILCADLVSCFAKSSGTTDARSKYIPMTLNFLKNCHYAGGKDAFSIYYHQHPHANLYGGKQLSLGGNIEENPQDIKKYFGDLSALMIMNLPFWAEKARAPSKKLALMQGDWEQKLEKMAQETMNQDIRSLIGVPSWLLILLRKILDIKGKKNIQEIWPNYQLYLHGGVAFEPYQAQFKKISPPETQYYQCYNASEGFFGLQYEPGAKDMLLMLNYNIFYEFIPLAELQKSTPEDINKGIIRTLHLSEVNLGQDYALVISTDSGLWRYLIGDTIRFTSLSPYKIQVSGRTKQHINVFGEELMVENVERALKIACEKSGAWVKEYTVAPIFIQHQDRGGHEWLIEFDKKPNQFDFFCQTLDENLQKLNSDYAAKRSYVIQFPTIKVVPEGTFYRWMKQKNKLGGQNKVPRLSNCREYLEDILNMYSENNIK